MEEPINFEGEKYISAKIASKKFGYTSDYVGQLCRQKKIKSHLVGRNWYVLESDLSEYKKETRVGLNQKSTLIKKVKKDKKKTNKEGFAIQSRSPEINSGISLYSKDERELLPDIIKKIDLDSVKFLALKRIEDSLSRKKERSDFEKFVVASVALLALTLSGAFIGFDGLNFVKSARNHFSGNPKEEVRLVYGPFLGDIKNKFASIGLTKNTEEADQNNQLAAASSGLAQSAWGWLKESAKKIIKPWMEEDGVLVIVNESSNTAGDVANEEGSIKPKAPTTVVQSRTVVVPASDREYLDLRIDQRFEELKNYFLTSSIAPNINRFYVTRQNDSIVDSISRTSSSSSGGSGGGSGASSLTELSDITFSSLTYGDLLMYNGTEWVNTATSSLGITVGSGASTTLLADFNTFSNTNNFTGSLGLSTTTPFARLSINNTAGENAFVVGSSTATDFIVNSLGKVGIGTSLPTGFLTVVNGEGQLPSNISQPALLVQNNASASDWNTVTIISGENGSGGIDFGDKDDNNRGGIYYAQDTDVMNFRTGDSANRLTISGPYVGIATATPLFMLNPFSSTAPQLSLSAGAGINQWAFRNAGGNFYLSTTTVAGTATTSISALEISGSGFGTTTVRGLNISGQATTTSNVGINLSGGCFAINGTCVSGGGSGASSTLLADFNTFSNTNNFTGSIGLSTTTPFARLSIENQAGENAFVVGSSTATWFLVDKNGAVGVGTTTPDARFTVYGTGGNILSWYNSAGTKVGYVNLNGTFYTTSGVANVGTVSNSWVNTGTTGTVISRNVADSNAALIVQQQNSGSTGDIFRLSNSASTVLTVNQGGNVGFGTSTPFTQLQVATTSSNGGFKPQFTLTDMSGGTNGKHWNLSSLGGNFYLGTSTDLYATTSISALEISGSGFGTTTVRGLNISGQATSTSNVGINLSGGCFSINNTCISGGGSSASSTLLADSNTWSGTNRFAGPVNLASVAINSILSTDASGNIVATSTPTFGYFNATSTNATSTIAGGLTVDGTSLVVDYANNKVGIGTAIPIKGLTVQQGGTSLLTNSYGDGLLFSTNNVAGARIFLENLNGATNQKSLAIVNENVNSQGTTYFGILSDDGSTWVKQNVLSINHALGNVGVSTSTPYYDLTIASSTAPQLSLSAGAGLNQWAFRNAGGNFYLSTTTVAGTATTSISALEISGSGFGTTTVRGLNISGQATSTSNVGINLSGGCFAVNGICISGSGLFASSTLLTDTNYWSGPNTFAGLLTNTYASSTYSSFATASTTNLMIGGQSFNSLLGSGLSNSSNVLTVSGLTTSNFSSANISQWTNDSGYQTFAWPFTANAGYVSTTTTLGLLNGFLSTASSTIVGSATTTGDFAAGNTLFVKSGGNVGIGTTDPLSKLHLYNAGDTDTTILLENGNGYGSIENDANTDAFTIKSLFGDLALYSGNTIRMNFDSGGDIQMISQTGRDTFFRHSDGLLGVGTSTNFTARLTVASSTALTDGAGIAQWIQRNAGGNFYLSTTTVDGLSTTSISALEISGSGFGTTTVRGLNIQGLATTTSNVGINLSGGCFAINGTCVGGGGSGASSTLLADFNTFSNTNNFSGKLAVGTTTPYYTLTVASSTGPQFALSDGAGLNQWTFRNAGGNFYLSTTTVAGTATSSLAALTINGATGRVGIATSTPGAMFGVENAGTGASFMVSDQIGDTSPFIIDASGNVGVGENSLSLKLHVLSDEAEDTVRISNSNASGYASIHWDNNSANEFYTGVGGSGTVSTFANKWYTYTPGGTLSLDTAGLLQWSGSQAFIGGSTKTLTDANDVLYMETTNGYTQFHMVNPDGANTDISAFFSVNATANAAFGTGDTNPGLQIWTQSAHPLRFATNATERMRISPTGSVGISTTTPYYNLTVASTTGPQFALSAGAGLAQWTQRNAGGNLYFSTTTVDGLSTTSISALEISGSGFGTTTVRGLNISGQATTTSNVGINLSGGCFAINGTCVGGGGSGASSTLLADFNTWSNTNNFTGSLGLSTTSPFARLSINNTAGENAFVVGSSTATSFMVDKNGNVGIGTTTYSSTLTVQGTGVSISSSEPTIALFVDNVNGSPAIALKKPAGAAGAKEYRLGLVGNGNNQFVVHDKTSNRYPLTITSNSLVGVNTTTPTAFLAVQGNTVAANQAMDLFMVASSSGSSYLNLTSQGIMGLSTTTPQYLLTVASSTAPQLSLSAGAGVSQWVQRNAGGNFYLSTTTVDGLSTTSISALEIAGGGFGTTTVRGLNISGQATTTSNVGINLSGGCFAINGTCVGGGGSGASSTLLADFNTWSNTNNFTGKIGVGSSTPFSKFSIHANNGETNLRLFDIASSTASATTTLFNVLNGGHIGVGVATTSSYLTIQGTVGTTDLFKVASSTGGSLFKVNNYGALVQKLSSTTAISIQDSSGNSVFSVDTTQTTGAGLDITAASGQTANLFNIYQSNGTTNYLAVGPSGNFGIGTGTPSHLFTVATSTTTKEPVFDIYYNSSGATSTVGFFVSTTTGSAAGVGLGLPSALANYMIVGNGKVQAGMAIVNGGLCIDNDGWCTASTTGRISSVTSTTGGSDVAEMYNSEEVLEPGDIVAIAEPRNFVKIASDNSRNRVIGIVSTEPGVLLGLQPDANDEKGLVEDVETDGEESAELATVDKKTVSKYPIALAGRVPVKVSTVNGEIEPGDYLMLSTSTPGVAVKAIVSGQVIGQALEGYSDSNLGKILVFVKNTYYVVSIPIVASETSSDISTTTSLSENDGFGFEILKFFESLGVKIMHGVAYVKNLFVEKLTIGTSENPTGITIYDEVTGDPYCMKVNNGTMLATPGACSITELGPGASEEPAEEPEEDPEPTATSTPPVATSTPPVSATSTDPIASTTPEIIPDETATSTPEIATKQAPEITLPTPEPETSSETTAIEAEPDPSETASSTGG